jgi:copper chaperone
MFSKRAIFLRRKVKIMNQAGTNFKSESVRSKNADSEIRATKSSCGCGCGTSVPTGINRMREEKTMTNSANESKTTTLTAPEIVCGGCASSIKKALGNVEGVSDVDVDVETKKVTVNHTESVSREKIADALDRAGFSVAP